MSVLELLQKRDNAFTIHDIEVVRSWVEYSQSGNLAYLLYEMDSRHGGEPVRLYKAIKLHRLIRVPKSTKLLKSFMDMQADVISGLYRARINFVQIIANVLKPKPIGLMFVYGVQSVSTESVDDAKRFADSHFAALSRVFGGTFRTMEMRTPTYEEMEWLRDKMHNMKHLQAVRGLPTPRHTSGDVNNSSAAGPAGNSQAEETTEEFIAGMSDYEYVAVLMATPIEEEVLLQWLTAISKDQTRWEGLLSGSRGINFGLSLPMMYMSNLGSTEGWSQGYSQGYSESHSGTAGISETHSASQSTSMSHTAGVSEGFSLNQGTSASESRSIGETFGVTEGTSETFGTSSSHTVGVSESVSESFSEGKSESYSKGTSYTETEGTSRTVTDSASRTVTDGTSRTVTDTTSRTVTDGTSESVSYGRSTGTTDTTSETHTTGTNQSHSKGTSTSSSTGTTSGWSRTDSTSDSRGASQSHSTNWSESTSTTHTDSRSHTDSSSRSEGKSSTNTVSGNVGGSLFGLVNVGGGGSHSAGTSEANTTGSADTVGTSDSVGHSSSRGGGETTSTSTTTTTGKSTSSSGGTTRTNTTGTTVTDTWGTSESTSKGTSHSVSVTDSETTTTGTSHSVSTGTSHAVASGTSHSTAIGTSQSVAEGVSRSVSRGTSETITTGTSQTYTVGVSRGTNESWTTGESHSVGRNFSTSHSQSVTDSVSKGVSQSQGQSFGRTASDTVGQSYSQSVSHGRSQSHTDGVSRSIGQNQGYSGALSAGAAGTMGVGPTLMFSKTYQWKDIEVENIIKLLQFQRDRLIAATNGQGAFFVDFFIATESEEAKASAKAVATSAWLNDQAIASPLQVLDLPPHEERHLLYHMNAFSPCLTKEGIPGQLESYKYSTVLLADELAAFTHPPRISEGGLYAEVEDMPVLAVPSNRQDGEIYVGQILSAERYSVDNGYVTPFQFRIRSDELMHAFFAGGSRSGKTVCATRVAAEMANNVRRGPYKKRLRIIAMDPKQDWRILARFVEPERFRFYSLADPDFLPVKLNLCKIPKNVWPERYMNSIVEIFCRSYGLGERGKQILTRAFYEEYLKAGCFRSDWRQHATERSAQVTMATVYENLARKREEMDDPRSKIKYGNDARDAFTRVMDRMEAFGRVGSIVHTMFCDPNGIGIDELLGKDDVVVLESYGLESTTRSFVFGLITSAIYQYCVHNGGFVNPPDQYETVLIIEEANEVLLGQDSSSGDQNGGGLSGPSEFERIVDQAAGNGLFIWAITQKISMMPTSIIANCGIVFAGRQKIPDDIHVCVRQIGREERYDDRPLVKWFPRCPTGWFIVQTSRTFDFKDAEPVLVKVEPLNVTPPSNEELEQLAKLRAVKAEV